MTGGNQEPAPNSWAATNARSSVTTNQRTLQPDGPTNGSRQLTSDQQQEPPVRLKAHDDQYEAEDNDEDLLSEALLAVASAEEYAAKILKLQQACLTPLKEDLADWLNKIMNMSTITTDNFMDKLDNGVIICRLAKIISLWCEQQLASITTSGQANLLQQQQQPQAHTRTSKQLKINTPTSRQAPQSCSSELSISTLNVYSSMSNNDTMANVENYETFNNHRSKKSITNAIVTPLRQLQPRSIVLGSAGGALKSSSQSTNCLTSSSTMSLNNEYLTSNRFLDNLIRMGQTKIWEDAKCRTFYARDNVCNFIKWSKEFGVNQSVLFESDDLVLHANTRQVVLCLLDVARIACVKHGFTEAPGLVKFEQEIDRELAAEKAAAVVHHAHNLDSGKQVQASEISANRKFTSLARNSRSGSVADATDDLIVRYCIHKEEEAAKKKAAELEAAAKLKAEHKAAEALASQVENESLVNALGNVDEQQQSSQAVNDKNDDDNHSTLIEVDSLMTVEERVGLDETLIKSPSSDLPTHKNNLITCDNRIDSLDSGEGRTESASTSHSRTPIGSIKGKQQHTLSAIPTLTKRSNSSSSLTTSSMGTSELSSSRSSLLSGHESNSTTKRHIASDLDGKVMRIAKSYYGKGATKGVTRLSEGKYKIADRIVFVRLLKGHRVMVRIGGGWDTLENFLFRHKSDPSQVIDVDNLLPLETKMTFEKNSQSTPTHNKFSKLPYYRRSSSASSTNLSTSNLSVSDHSPTSNNKTSTDNSLAHIKNPMLYNSIEQSHNHQSTNKQTPYFLIHRGQNSKLTPQPAFYNHPNHQAQEPHPKESSLTSQQQSQLRTPNSIRYNNRTLGSSRTPAISATNLYPATLTTRLTSTGMKVMGGSKINSTNNLCNNGQNSKQEAFRKLGRSNDSLQASFYKSPYHRQHPQNGSSNIGNLGPRKRSTPVEGRLMV